VQASVNKQLGLDEATFVKHNHALPSQLSATQREMNERLGLKEEDFLKFSRA
jgi:hypothetical protein